jgi:hypothetical protein
MEKHDLDVCMRKWDFTSQECNMIIYGLGFIFAIWSFFKNYQRRKND